MIRQNRYVIAVPDLDRSSVYYRDVLGFEVHEIGDDGWRFFVLDDCIFMAGQCPDAMPVSKLGDHSYIAYIVLEDVDAYYARVSAAGGEIIKLLRTEPWGWREFALRTIDGHRIMFATPVSS